MRRKRRCGGFLPLVALAVAVGIVLACFFPIRFTMCITAVLVIILAVKLMRRGW